MIFFVLTTETAYGANDGVCAVRARIIQARRNAYLTVSFEFRIEPSSFHRLPTPTHHPSNVTSPAGLENFVWPRRRAVGIAGRPTSVIYARLL